MDPVSALSVAAAAAQFAEQVLIISERLYQFFKTVKNAPKLSRELRQEALLLSDTLENLRSVFTAPDASKALRKASPSADLLQGFEETIKQIAARVEIKEGEASWKRLVWPFTQKENEDYLAKLERFKSSFQLALQVLQSSKLDNIEFTARRIDYTVQHSHQLNIDTSQQRRQEKRLRILNWIYAQEFDRRHREIARVRVEGSADWFLDLATYRAWLSVESDSNVLFCHGMPGCGKSVIMSRVVDELRAGTSKTQAVGYIYFDYNDPNSFEPENIIRTLLKQLLFNLRAVPDILEKFYDDCKDKGKSADVATLKEQLLLNISKFHTVFLLFDALDEISADRSKDVMVLMSDFGKTGSKIFCTSRINTQRVRAELGNPIVQEMRANHQDIVCYITTRLDREYDYDQESKQQISDSLTDKVEGKFLLVKFQLDYVLDFAEPSDAIECLSVLPTDMESAYKLVLDRIERKRRPTVMKILSWLFHARRPLGQDEIREAIAVRHDRTTLPKPLINPDALIEYCQGLVAVDESTKIVRFSHFTVKEFLFQHYQGHLLPVVDCAKICLTYINFTVFEKGPCASMEEYCERRKEYIFSEYVSQFWGGYVRGEGESDENVIRALARFFKCPSRVAAIRQIEVQARRDYRRVSFWPATRRDWTPLHVIASQGLSRVCAGILMHLEGVEEIDFVNRKDAFGLTPLRLAAENGYYAIAIQLIENGADVSAKCIGRWTALHAAAQEGHLEIVKVLLEKDVEINAKNGLGMTALCIAFRGSHLEIIKLLLESGVDINEKDDLGLTPLHKAVWGGHLEIVQALLEKDVEINAKDYAGRTALQIAVKRRDLEIVKALCQKDVYIHEEDSHGETALYLAVRARHLQILKVLLEKDVKIDAKDGSAWTALHQAIEIGDFEIVKVLLEKDVDINAKGYAGLTALQVAVMRRDLEIVKVLLEKDADIHEENSYGQTALHLAVRARHLQILKALLEKDVKIDAKDGSGRTALHQAIEIGDFEIVKVLLEKDVDINAKGYSGCTALHRAVEESHLEIIKMLLERGADINEEDDYGQTVVHNAAWKADIAVISLLYKSLDSTAPSESRALDANEEFTDVITALQFLTTKFPEDDRLWRALGNEFFRRTMYSDAIETYDTSVRKAFTNEATRDLDSVDFLLDCSQCDGPLNGYHYKCKSCCWHIDYCQNCVHEGLWKHRHSIEDLLQIPSHWPLTPEEDEPLGV